MIDLTRAQSLFSEHQISLSLSQLEQLDRYAQLLVEWNQKMNLTAITDPEGILIKHFLDSILPFTLVPLPQGALLIDVGTGAGFPAIPLLIWRPDLQITLLDSLKKRLTFLEAALSACGLAAQVIHCRAEDGGRRPDLREQFDLATARAVANLRELSEYCLPYIKPGGMFYALKGGDAAAEIRGAEKAIHLLGGRLGESISYSLPDGSGRTPGLCKKNIANFDKIPPKCCKNGKIPSGVMSNPAGISRIPAYFAIFLSGIPCIFMLCWS